MRKLALSLTLVLGLSSAGLTQDQFDPTIERVWTAFGHSKNACPKEYDYFPGGGMRIFNCHVKQLMSYSAVQKYLGQTAFLKGPHTRNKLVLNAPNYFGHYNPEFVNAATQRMIPENPTKIALTQPIYNQFVRPLARIHYVTYKKWAAHPKELEQEANQYSKMVEEDQLHKYYYEKFFYFMNPNFFVYQNNGSYLMKHGFDGGFSGNVVKTAASFWVRRHIDGTADEFYAGLLKLLKTYDKGFLQLQEHSNGHHSR